MPRYRSIASWNHPAGGPMVLRTVFGVMLAALVATGVPGCGDDSVKPLATGAVEGIVTDVNDHALGGISVILVDPATVSTASPLSHTDAMGRYRIDAVPPGDYSTFVYGAGSRLSFARTADHVRVEASTTTAQDIKLIVSDIWRDGPLYTSGTVTDARTGAPVAGAF